MRFKSMETVLYYKPEKSTRLYTPGNQGVIGATATQIRLKQTDPNFPRRFKVGTTGRVAQRYGSDTSVGDTRSQFTGSKPGEIHFRQSKDQRLRYNGWKVTDNYPNQDRNDIALTKQVPYYSWTLLKDAAKPNYGVNFQDLPGGYGPPPGALLRGNNYPSSTIIRGRNAPDKANNELIFKIGVDPEKVAAINKTKRHEEANNSRQGSSAGSPIVNTNV